MLDMTGNSYLFNVKGEAMQFFVYLPTHVILVYSFHCTSLLILFFLPKLLIL